MAKVLVVGAGLSGLCAARKLLKELPEHNEVVVTVLEASDRVGGRLLTQEIEQTGVKLDMGGQWVGLCQKDIIRIADELNIERYPQFRSGKTIMEVNGKISKYSTSIPSGIGILGLIDLQRSIKEIETLMLKVPPDEPHLCKNAASWDSKTCQTWIDEYEWTEDAKALTTAMIRGIFGVEPSDVSFLHLLNYCRSSGGVEKLVTIKDGLQEQLFHGGAQQICEKLLEELQLDKKFQLYKKMEVVEITQIDGKVSADCRNGAIHQSFDFVIIACAPAVANRIRFRPALSTSRQQLMKRQFMGKIVKIQITYAKAFWRSAGLSGEVIADAKSGPVFNVYDKETLSNKTGKVQPGLVCFINGDNAIYWSQQREDDRKLKVIRQLVSWFGNSAANYEHFIEKDWCCDEWSDGCPVGVWPPGALKSVGHCLRAREGRIFWAGTETAERSQGFMDGAVISGERAAEQIVSVILGRPKPSQKVIVKEKESIRSTKLTWLLLVVVFAVIVNSFLFYSYDK